MEHIGAKWLISTNRGQPGYDNWERFQRDNPGKFMQVYQGSKQINDVCSINTYAFPHKVVVLKKDKNGDVMVDKKTQELMTEELRGIFHVAIEP